MKTLTLVRTFILAGSLLLQLGTLCFHSRGAAGDVDLSFDPGSGVNGPVNVVVVQPDGKVLIGGQFTTVRGLARTNLARLNADGSGDPTFNPIKPYNAVSALALQSDGKVLVGGNFWLECDDFDCYSPTVVVRLNTNGSLDNSFNPAIAEKNNGTDSRYQLLAVQPDGKVLVAGDFYAVNGTNRYGFARLNSNGTLDANFNPVAVTGVSSFAPQSDGKVLIVGGAIVNGTNRYGIFRLNANGGVDGSFNFDTELGGENPRIVSIVVQSDGKVFIGGRFTNANGNSILRLNANGSLDSSFNSGTGANGEVSSIAMQSDGRVLIGGYFTTVNGTNRNRIARLNVNGSLDNSFNPGIATYGYELSLVVQSDGKSIIRGFFETVNSANLKRIARLNVDGSLDGSFDQGTGLGGPVAALAVQPDGRVLIGGALAIGGRWFEQPSEVFAFVSGTNRYGRARLNADGSLDSTFISSRYFNPDLAALIHYEDCPADPNYGCSQSFFATAVLLQPDGKVLISGDEETTITGDSYLDFIDHTFFGRFNADGSRDPSFEPPGYGTLALALQPDGKVIVGGIARLNANGSRDGSFNPGGGPNGVVSSVAMQSDGKVLIGGGFTAVNGTNRSGIARLNANGSLDSSFNPGTGVGGYPYAVNSVVVQSDGKVLIGGSFTSVNGTNRNRIARLHADGSLDSTFNPGTGPNGDVASLVLQSDGNVVIGGDFTEVNGLMRRYAARLYGDSRPSLNIAQSNATVVLSWPMSGLNLQLQENRDFALPNSWSPVAQLAVTNGAQISVTIPASAAREFFRLKSQ